MATPIWAKGLWLSKIKKKTGEETSLLKLSVSRDNFIKFLQELQPTSKGYVFLTAGTKKDKPDEYNVWVDEYTAKNSGINGHPSAKDNAGELSAQTDDLPF